MKKAKSTTPVPPPYPYSFLPTFFKDYVSVLKIKNLFFVPSYGALLGFLVSQSEYVLSAPWHIKLGFAASFAVSTFYAAVVTQFLTQLEKLGLIFNLDQQSHGEFFKSLSGSPDSEQQVPQLPNGDISELAKELASSRLTKMIGREDQFYRLAMNSLYFLVMFVLFDIYLKASYFYYANRLLSYLFGI